MSAKDALEKLDNLIWQYEDFLSSYLKSCEFTYSNLSETSKFKILLFQYIQYIKLLDKSWISTQRFLEIHKILEDAWLIKDRSWEELWKQIQERETWEKITAEVKNFSGKIWDVIEKK